MNHKKFVFKSIIVVFGLCLLIWRVTPPAWTSNGSSLDRASNGGLLVPLKEHPTTCRDILRQLKQSHYRQIPVDDALSNKVFDTYLSELDPSRRLFMASDINEFEVYRDRFDDLTLAGDLGPAFDIYNRFIQRATERFEFLLTCLENGLSDLSFEDSETIEIDRKDAAWPVDRAELDDMSRKNLKSSALSLKLADKSMEEIAEILTKRFENQLNRIQQSNSEDAFETFMNSLSQQFDPHTTYFSPVLSEEFGISMSQSLEGIGALLRTKDEYTTIVSLIPAGPAEKSELLKPADRIVGVGQGPEGEIVDVVGWRLDEVVKLIRGPKKTIVRLKILPVDASDEQAKVISIERNTVKLEEQTAKKEILQVEHQGRSVNVAVIDLPTFYLDFKAAHGGDPNYRSSTRDVKKILQALSDTDVEGLVIDLRNNGGGLLQEAIELTGLLIKQGPVVQVRAAGGRIEILNDLDNAIYYDGPLAILTNRMSASASEILAGAVQDYGRGIVIGERTFGKGTVQAMMTLDRGQLKATIAKFYRITGGSTQHKGIVPDISYPTMHDVNSIGESALTEAMPWDTIGKITYPSYGNPQPFMTTLRDRHLERQKHDPDYTYRLAMIDYLQEMRKKNTLSLNEEVRRKERKDADEWQLTLENTRRLAKNQTPIETLDELESTESQDSQDDPLLIEAARILLDYAELLKAPSEDSR
ncbi:MAG: carboxy terminal-processing peptidase [Phycisphaerae bacterium]|nr:carboxy terminal-processing peptidase [Phycisphaerae bacterium]